MSKPATLAPSTPKPMPGLDRAPQNSAASKRRLGFKERYALDQLPNRMDELRTVKARLQAALDDAGLYGRDPDRFAKLSAALAETEAKLSEAEEEWLNLELLREEIEG